MSAKKYSGVWPATKDDAVAAYTAGMTPAWIEKALELHGLTYIAKKFGLKRTRAAGLVVYWGIMGRAEMERYCDDINRGRAK